MKNGKEEDRRWAESKARIESRKEELSKEWQLKQLEMEKKAIEDNRARELEAQKENARFETSRKEIEDQADQARVMIEREALRLREAGKLKKESELEQCKILKLKLAKKEDERQKMEDVRKRLELKAKEIEERLAKRTADIEVKLKEEEELRKEKEAAKEKERVRLKAERKAKEEKERREKDEKERSHLDKLEQQRNWLLKKEALLREEELRRMEVARLSREERIKDLKEKTIAKIKAREKELIKERKQRERREEMELEKILEREAERAAKQKAKEKEAEEGERLKNEAQQEIERQEITRMREELQQYEAHKKALQDAKQAAMKKADQIQREANERQKALQAQIVADAARTEKIKAKSAKEAEERAARIAQEQKKLEQIVQDKERREKAANHANKIRKAAIDLVEKENINFLELERKEALAASKVKIEQRKFELEEKVKKSEKKALKKAKKQLLKMERKEKKLDSKKQKMEEEFSEMQSKLKIIETNANEARKQLKKPIYKLVSDDDNENDGEELTLLQSRASALLHVSETKVPALNEIKPIDNTINLDFDVDDHLKQLEDVEAAEEKRQEIVESLKTSKETSRNNNIISDGIEEKMRLRGGCCDIAYGSSENREELAFIQERANPIELESSTKIKSFDCSIKLDTDDHFIESVDLKGAEEKREKIEAIMKKACVNTECGINEVVIEPDNTDVIRARAAAATSCDTKGEKAKKQKKAKKVKTKNCSSRSLARKQTKKKRH